MIRAIDETGNTYGYLTVETRVGNGQKGQVRWRCKCKCGKRTDVRGANLRQGLTKSCGCLIRERRNTGNVNKAHAMHTNGHSIVYIAAHLKVCTGTVYRYLRVFK